MAKIPAGVGPKYPQVVVLVGATGDLSRRKLLPGLFHLSGAGFIPGCRIIGVSLDDLDPDGFRAIARGALDQFSTRKANGADWAVFAEILDYVPLAAGADGLKAAVERAERTLGADGRRLHYLSVPPTPLCQPCGCWEKPISSTGPGSSWKSRSARTSQARCR